MTPASAHVVVAIDGPAASGKSSVARTLARRLGFLYVNTGAMYRAVTWHLVQSGVAPTNADEVARVLLEAEIRCDARNHESTMTINGLDATPHLLEEAVNANVSHVAAVPAVRQRLVEFQRAYAQTDDLVMEGRDIGSVVFPETPFKFYIDASAEVRAARRHRQGLSDAIWARDRQDSSRRASPLIIAEDAHVIDSSHLTIDGVVGEIIGRLKLKGLAVEEK